MPASFEMKGGRNIESNARKRVAEKNDEAIPKMQKKILFVLDMALITLACLEDTKTEDHSGHFALQPGFSLLKGGWCIESHKLYSISFCRVRTPLDVRSELWK